MPPKQKPKKGGLDDKQIETTIDIVKQYWPDYPIFPENIRHPTREFILKFYTECVNNLDEKCAFVTRSNLISYPPGLGEEELLFLKLSRIPSLVSADFRLGDLFTYDPKRVSNHIFVTMHFLIFTETLMDEMVQICNSVFDTTERMYTNQEDLKQLKEDKTQTQINLTLAKSENKKLKAIASKIAPKYEETLQFIEESEKKCKDSILEIEKLKSEVENVLEEIEKYEKTELQLKQQIVTEEEYANLKSTVESLKKEEKSLEEIDLSNDLFKQKQHIEYLQQCLQELNHLGLAEDFYKLSDVRVQLKNEQQNLEYASTIQQKKATEMEQFKMQMEQQKHAIESTNKILEEKLKNLMESALMEEMKLEKKLQQTIETNTDHNEDLNKDVEKHEADLKRLKNELLEKYKVICNIQNMALERFKLSKFSEYNYVAIVTNFNV